MYGSLYKLFYLIKVYINKTFSTNKKICDIVNVDTDYPIYKDLEPYKDYDFEIIVRIHEKIIEIIKMAKLVNMKSPKNIGSRSRSRSRSQKRSRSLSSKRFKYSSNEGVLEG